MVLKKRTETARGKVATAKTPASAKTKKVAVKKSVPANNKKLASKTTATSAKSSNKATKAKPTVKAAEPMVKKATPALTSLQAVSGAMGIAPYQLGTDEEYMNEQQRAHFRSILLRWKQQLMTEVDSTIHHMQDDAANFPDPNDRATQEEEFSLELRARDRERKLIKKIEEALQKIESQEYGYCEECGIEIGIRRLEARPTANLCIDCKTLDEIKEKQLVGG